MHIAKINSYEFGEGIHFHKFNLKKKKIYSLTLTLLYFTCLHVQKFLSLKIKFFLYVIRKRVTCLFIKYTYKLYELTRTNFYQRNNFLLLLEYDNMRNNLARLGGYPTHRDVADMSNLFYFHFESI